MPPPTPRQPATDPATGPASEPAKDEPKIIYSEGGVKKEDTPGQDRE